MSESMRRVAIVDGLRTPFMKMGTAFAGLSARELGVAVVAELVRRSGVEPRLIQQVVFGQVVPSLASHNVARDIALEAGLPPQVEAYSVARACATSYQSTVCVAQAIATGDIDCGIAGGADSASDVPVGITRELRDALLRAQRARSWVERWRAFRRVRPRHLHPVPMALVERSTGLSMGQSAEKMAKENHISRADQDAFAHRSHTRAAEAWERGQFAPQVMRVFVPPEYLAVEQDNLFRRDSELGAYQRLRPVFDREHGSITAGNSSPLTDGASALLLMSEELAHAHGYPVLGTLRAHAFAALNPGDQLLMGPAYATPVALDRAGVRLSDLDLIDIHEAFAAQVLSNTQAFESTAFAAEKLGRGEAIGRIDWDRLNVSGGSIALGHPFAATGARQMLQSLHELRRRGGGLALCTACAAGGLGAAVILEAR